MKEDQLREGEGRGLFTLKNLILLIIGFILGYIIKGQFVQTVTMGYDDYKAIVKEKQQKEDEKEVEKIEENIDKGTVEVEKKAEEVK
jgi:uncharacterized membrane protein YciS (DUF1049 family)